MKLAFENVGICLILFAIAMWLANWGSGLSLIISLALCFIYSVGISKIGLDDEDDGISLGNFLGVTISAVIFLSAPIWNEQSYCSNQITSEVTSSSIVINDIVVGRSNSDVYIYSDSANCLEQGAWTYMKGLEKILLIILLIPHLAILIYLISGISEILPSLFSKNNFKITNKFGIKDWQEIDTIIENKKNLSGDQKLIFEIETYNDHISRLKKASQKKIEVASWTFKNGIVIKSYEYPLRVANLILKIKKTENFDIKDPIQNLKWYMNTIEITHTTEGIPGLYNGTKGTNQSKNSQDIGTRKKQKLENLIYKIEKEFS